MVTLMMVDSCIYKESIKKVASEITVEGGNILITGASGLIGSCLIDVLLEANRTCKKNFRIYAVGRSEKRLKNRFGTDENLIYIVQDVSERISINGINYIVHAASNADPRSYALYPVETIVTNILGAKNVLDCCRSNNARALLTSSFEIYGNSDQDIYSENDSGNIDLSLIRSCYPESKRVAEMLFKSYVDEYDTDCVIVRLSSVFGPTMLKDDSKAHAQFLRNAIEGKDIVLKSKGTQKRTYCYIIDAISGILTVLLHGKSGDVYNVANGQSIATIFELAQIIATLSGTSVVFDKPDCIEFKGFSRPQNCILDTKKIESLGWKGRYTLKEGIVETLSILNEVYNNK